MLKLDRVSKVYRTTEVETVALNGRRWWAHRDQVSMPVTAPI